MAWIWKLIYLILELSTLCLPHYLGRFVTEFFWVHLLHICLPINLFAISKLGVPIKTTISANVLEEAMSGTVTVRPLPVGSSVSGKVNNNIYSYEFMSFKCIYYL